MRNFYKFFLLSAIIFSLGSCSKEQLPTPVVGFTVSSEIIEVNIPVTFTNTTTNATKYEWTFGDGQISDEVSPTIFYEEPGDYTVTLIAFTDDNQSVEFSQDVTVGVRQLYEIIIHSLSFVNDTGEDWDTIDPDSASFKYPDFWFIMGPDDDPDFEFTIATLFGNIVGDLSPNQLSIVFSGAGAIVPLTDADWTIAFYDFDGVDIDNVLEDDISELMSFISFNPVQDAVPDASGDGALEVSQGLYQVELVFKVE